MPDWTPALRARLASLDLQPAREAEIVEELTSHLDDRYEELRRAGCSADEASRLALDDLAGVDVLARHMRPLRQAHSAPAPVPGAPRTRWFGDFRQDLRYAVRMFGQQPGFTAAALVTLALGIGANTAIFSLVNATLLQRLMAADSARLVYVHNGPSSGAVFSYPAFSELRDGQDVFDGLLAWGPIAASMNADGETDLVTGAIVTGNYFDVLGISAVRGRALGPSDDVTPGAHPVAVITYGLWQRRFGERPDIVGHNVVLNGQPFTIVGVLPAGFGGAQLGVVRDLFVPMMMQPVMRPPRAGFSGEMNADLLTVRGNSWLFALGRLKPAMTEERAEVTLGALATTIARASQPDARQRQIALSPVDGGVPGQRAQMVPVARLLMFVVGAVLLIACANVANLLLSRAASRRREIAVRLAIGASRGRLVRQFLTESVLLSVVGGAAGVLLAWLGVRMYSASPPPAGALPVTLDFSVDARVLAFSAALAVLTGLVFGLAPALRASRPALVPSLKDDSFVPDERARRLNLRKSLVVVEVALSVALLITAGLFIRSRLRTQAVDPGFDAAKLLDAPLNVNLLRYTRAQGREFYDRVVEQVSALPGVESAAVARQAPMAAARLVSLQIQGRAGTGDTLMSEGGSYRTDNRTLVNANVIGAGYFRTMGIRLQRGRDFSAADDAGAPPVVIVNQAFADRHFAGEEAIGQRISTSGPQGPWREIVGIVSDSKYQALLEDRTTFAYLPISQNHETGVTLLVRTSGDPASRASAVRREVQALEPNLPLPAIQPMETAIGTSIYAARMGAWLLAFFAALALLLASVGVYGVLAFSISRRTREFGVRMALGAERRALFALVLREGMSLVTIGVALGLAAAALGGRPLERFLFGVSRTDVVTFVVVPMLLALVALAACLVPARRAMQVDPTVALRSGQ